MSVYLSICPLTYLKNECKCHKIFYMLPVAVAQSSDYNGIRYVRYFQFEEDDIFSHNEAYIIV